MSHMELTELAEADASRVFNAIVDIESLPKLFSVVSAAQVESNRQIGKRTEEIRGRIRSGMKLLHLDFKVAMRVNRKDRVVVAEVSGGFIKDASIRISVAGQGPTYCEVDFDIDYKLGALSPLRLLARQSVLEPVVNRYVRKIARRARRQH